VHYAIIMPDGTESLPISRVAPNNPIFNKVAHLDTMALPELACYDAAGKEITPDVALAKKK